MIDKSKQREGSNEKLKIFDTVIECFSASIILDNTTVNKGINAFTVCVYEIGTNLKLICEANCESNFPMANGTIIIM